MRAAHRLSVLVVDDHPGSAESLADLLGFYGHRVVIAHTAREALAAADAEPPDVVLLDIRLPDMDGWQVARWLREQALVQDRPHLLLVAVTGCGREEDFRRSAQAGFDLHLIKPVDPNLLVQLLADHDSTAAECGQPVRVPVGA